jgi:hypothetical protein
MKVHLVIAILFIFVSCVGVDVEDIILLPKRLEITDYPVQLQEGEIYSLEATKFDSIGDTHIVSPTWTSSDPTKATISGNTITGVSQGVVTLHAVYEDLSAEVSVTITADTTQENAKERAGILMGNGGYEMSGNFRIYEDDMTGETMLEFIDAMIDDGVPGPVYYLSNSTSSIADGVRLGEATSGSVSYNLGTDVTINTFSAVVIWCDPFNVLLGYGEFEN